MRAARSATGIAAADTMAIVIGAGLGGLLAAARLLRSGYRVLVLERADRPRGRFTAWIDGRHVICRHPWDIARLLSWSERLEALRLLTRMARAGRGRDLETWIRRDLSADHRLVQLARAFSEFALSLPLQAVSCAEMRAVMFNTWRLGLPGIPLGGCRAVTGR